MSDNELLRNDSGEIATEELLYILCVDDEVDILKSLTRVFRKEPFEVLTATSGQEALNILRTTKNIGVVLSDQRMPEMNGSELLGLVKDLVPDAARMILTGYSDLADTISAINQGGAEQFLTKPWEDDELLRCVRGGFQRYQLILENRRLQQQEKELNELLTEWNSNLRQRVLAQTSLIRNKLATTKRQKMNIQQTSDALLKFIDFLEGDHHWLTDHSRIVAALTVSMTDFLNLSPAQRKVFKTAALLHDIGLFDVSEHILDGCIPLMGTAEYREHPIKGEELLAMNEQFKDVALIIRHHHERYDGSGFPDGLSGERIPLGSRIIHIASFIATTYAAETGADAKYQITSKLGIGMGSHFDPALVSAGYRAVQEVLVSSGGDKE